MAEHGVTRRSALALGVAALVGRAGWAGASETPADVLILGAGLSGLHAARMLQSAGLKVTVLEASQRIGGRCWTATDVPGRPELGASEIGAGYGRVRGNAAELGVALDEPKREAGGSSHLGLGAMAISVYGQPADARPWADSPLNRLAPHERKLLPLQLFGHYAMRNSPLSDLSDWLKPEFAKFDNMSLRQYFIQQGASPEALRLLNVNLAGRNLDEVNALEILRKINVSVWETKAGGIVRVRGGTSALTDAMAASLSRPVQLKRVARRIEAGPTGTTVTCADGSVHRARACLSTIPLSVMKSLRIDGVGGVRVPAQQREAWGGMPYCHLIQVFMEATSPFWEKDGLSRELWTDGPIERVLATGGNRMVAFINGEVTDRYKGMNAAQIGEFVLREMARLRPATAGAVRVLHVHDWDAQPYQLGHMANFVPGGIGRYMPYLDRPIGSLYFAGEHCGKLHSGMEAACESGEAAAMRMLEDLDRS